MCFNVTFHDCVNLKKKNLTMINMKLQSFVNSDSLEKDCKNNTKNISCYSFVCFFLTVHFVLELVSY